LIELQKAFKALDKNSDGKLSRDELVEGYRSIYGDMAEVEVDRILARVDANGSGEIDYSGMTNVCLTFSRMDRCYNQ
jgi:calcium-dependent protein kinase